MQNRWVKPVVVISRCLDMDPVRYNGQVIPYDFVGQLAPWVRFVPVCPEVEIGLGVPRDPVRIVAVDGEARLVQPGTGRDLTDAMADFAERFLGQLGDVDGFLLKNRSPSCGISDVKVYQGGDAAASATRGPGLFGGRVLERHPGLAIEDEGRLRNYRIREHFLTRLFALARLRIGVAPGGPLDLVRFQAENKFLLMAYDQGRARELGRIVANPQGRPYREVLARYREAFQIALREPPRPGPVVNVLEHISGFFSARVIRDERDFFKRALEHYREDRIPISGVTSILRAWAVRFDERYLLPQTFFQPYPAALMNVSDSGKGRV